MEKIPLRAVRANLSFHSEFSETSLFFICFRKNAAMGKKKRKIRVKVKLVDKDQPNLTANIPAIPNQAELYF